MPSETNSESVDKFPASVEIHRAILRRVEVSRGFHSQLAARLLTQDEVPQELVGPHTSHVATRVNSEVRSQPSEDHWGVVDEAHCSLHRRPRRRKVFLESVRVVWGFNSKRRKQRNLHKSAPIRSWLPRQAFRTFWGELKTFPFHESRECRRCYAWGGR